MQLRIAYASLWVKGLLLAVVPLGCGAAQEDYALIEPSREAQFADVESPKTVPVEAQNRMQACISQHRGPWSHYRYATRYEATSNNRGVLDSLKLRETTLDDQQVETCIRGIIANLTVPDSVLRSRRPGPISGGETMRREQRGPLGSNDSQNPLVWVFFVALESVEIEVTIQVLVGAIAAVGTIATSTKKDPKKVCRDRYVDCQDTPLGNLQVDVWGTTVCESCRSLCVKANGSWPPGFQTASGWQTCN